MIDIDKFRDMIESNKLSIEDENSIIELSDSIKGIYFISAQKKWKETPDNEKQRPWPRCNNLNCNRTLACQRETTGKCDGFDY